MTDLHKVGELISAVEVWQERSRHGEVCGIFGCPKKPVTQCAHCQNFYCEEHKFVIGTPAHNMGVKLNVE